MDRKEAENDTHVKREKVDKEEKREDEEKGGFHTWIGCVDICCCWNAAAVWFYNLPKVFFNVNSLCLTVSFIF